MTTEDKLPNENRENLPANNTLETKIAFQAETLEKLSAQVQSLEQNLKKRKTEVTTLKVLFYTAFLVLLAGWIYSTTTLQRAQLHSMDSSIALLQKRMKVELTMTQRILYDEIQRVRTATHLARGEGLPGVLARMNDTVALVEPASEKQAELVQKIKQDSEELTKAFTKYKARLLAASEKP